MLLLSARKLNSRFNMMIIMKYPWIDPNYSQSSASSSYSSGRNSSHRREIVRWDSLSPYGEFPSQSVLGIRSLFLIILLNHLPQEIQFFSILGLWELISHSVFWDIFLMHLTFPILQSQQSEYFLPNLEGFPKSSFILRFPVCQEVLDISQIATAFHRIRLPLIIRSRLQ